jgi:hypothetical protein
VSGHLSGNATYQELKKNRGGLAYNRVGTKVMRPKPRTSSKDDAEAKLAEAFVGTWEEVPNRGGTTSVVYAIRVEGRKFVVAGVDEDTGESLKVSRIKWDRKSLRFTTLFKSNSHKCEHVVRVLRGGKMSHHVSGVYFGGEAFSDDEVWRKRSRKMKKIKTKTLRLRGKS